MRKILCAALGAALLLSGCAGTEPADATRSAPATAAPVSSGGTWLDEMEPAAKGGDTAACPMPVAFDTPAKWKVAPFELSGEDFIDDLARRGDATMVCELLGRGAGKVAFLRVYTAPGDPKAALEAFLAAGTGYEEIVYRDRPSGAVEATFISTSEIVPDGAREYILAAKTAEGTALVVLDGSESDEAYGEYVLARNSLTVTG